MSTTKAYPQPTEQVFLDNKAVAFHFAHNPLYCRSLYFDLGQNTVGYRKGIFMLELVGSLTN